MLSLSLYFKEEKEDISQFKIFVNIDHLTLRYLMILSRYQCFHPIYESIRSSVM